MEKYIAKVYANNWPFDFTPWFKNLMRSISQDHSSDDFNDALSQYNAIYVPGTANIEFDSEADFLMFKLKFS